MQDKNKIDNLFNIGNNKNVMNVDGQKEIIEHAIKTNFKYSMMAILIILPLIFSIVIGILFVLGVFKF